MSKAFETLCSLNTTQNLMSQLAFDLYGDRDSVASLNSMLKYLRGQGWNIKTHKGRRVSISDRDVKLIRDYYYKVLHEDDTIVRGVSRQDFLTAVRAAERE